MSILRRKKEAPPPPPPPPNIVIQVQPQPQPEVHVKEHTRRIPFIERPKDADARRILREAKLRKKLERKGLLPRDQTEVEKMAKEAQDLSDILTEVHKKQKEFDEK